MAFLRRPRRNRQDTAELDAHTLTRRPEQLSVEEFIQLTNDIEKLMEVKNEK